MKGVVRPHAIPTRRKPRVQRKMEGEGAAGSSVVVDIVGVDGRELGVCRWVGWWIDDVIRRGCLLYQKQRTGSQDRNLGCKTLARAQRRGWKCGRGGQVEVPDRHKGAM